ncbi:hypothetical protein [Streptomyces cadmiisoli]|uniref:hypothetical protein n=1 Tax=Streptomyces cadmiisoli TaxID=2184053 RepID=UPI0013A6CE99|nr:hypothetical protein [Streptomyces cadmiisoli]
MADAGVPIVVVVRPANRLSAEVDGAVVYLGEVGFGAGEADVDAFNVAGPAVAFRFGDAGGKVVEEFGEAGPGGFARSGTAGGR